MSLGNLGWNNLLLGINGGVNNPTLFRNEENEEVKLMQKIPTGLRLTQEGHLTNAPETMGDGEYAHRIIYSNNAKNALTVEFDERWKEICPDVRATIGSIEFTTVESKADDITNGRAVDGFGEYTCDEEGTHYWIDKTQTYTRGCRDSEATNFSDSDDFVDNSLCVYGCDDVNRIPNSDGSCSDSCSEGYELRDRMCQLGATDRLKNTVVEKAGVGVLIVASAIGLKFFLRK